MAVIADRCLMSIRKFGTVQGVNGICLGFLVLMFAVAQIGATPSGCDIKMELESLRNLDLPDRPTQGPVCGANSCCGPAENKLKVMSKMEVEKFVKDSITSVASLLETRSRRLEDLFRDMMQHSKKELHKMFEKTYGMIYLQNSNVFTDFFSELDKYYSHGGISLTETMDHFFSILYQRMFKVINSQYDFSEEYLTCVARDIAKLKPFGDIPMKLATLLRRSFVATRIFHKTLMKGAQLVEKMIRVNISEDCGVEVTKMQYCNHCTNQREQGPCTAYCTDTVKGCLKYFVEFNDYWDTYIESLDKVADKLLGPFNIEMVVDPINVKISEAIMNFQESGAEVSQKVFVECGPPKLKGDRRRRAAETANSQNQEITYQPLQFRGSKKKHKKTNDYASLSPMDKKITEVKQKIKETRNFWSHLPYQYCNNVTTALPTENENCWNGTMIGTYTTPPVQPKPTQPTILLEQIYSIQVLIHKLKSAYQGQDEELLDDDEEESMITSGSGSGSDEDISEDVDVKEDPTTTTTTTTTTESIIFDNVPDDDDTPKVMTASASGLTKALAHYILPIVMVWFGGAVTELL